MATQAPTRRRGVKLLLVLLIMGTLAMVAQALPLQDDSSNQAKGKRSPMPTPFPRVLSLNPRSTPDEVYAFYSPRDVVLNNFADSNGLEKRGTPTKRQDQPSVPLSSLGPPTFPANIPSCPKCEERYSSLSSCMGASSVFANATSIFSDPVAYINVIKCACTDTFQAVYPQCLDCFQHTDQCYYLGTDPQGTGANKVISNLRSICGLGSALLGGVASANNNIGTNVPVNPPSYTDVSTTGAGYKDSTTGAIFQSSGGRSIVDDALHGWGLAAVALAATGLALLGGAARIAY
ncbi:hypothetical protein L1887_54156 [Cichorium endivia]|nr:hypothetical protein L1887_54156 [Cichorium endivia]